MIDTVFKWKTALNLTKLKSSEIGCRALYPMHDLKSGYHLPKKFVLLASVKAF